MLTVEQQGYRDGVKAAFSKSAEAPGDYNIQNFGTQQYLPVQNVRDFSPQEAASIRSRESRLLPKIWQSYGTPIPELLANPGKQGLAGALAGGLTGASAGALLGGSAHAGKGALVGGGLGASLLGSLAYFSRRKQNEDIKELMRRLPQGATKRDMFSDPAYQADINRRTQMQSAALMASALGRR